MKLEARGGFDWIERKESSLGLFIKRLNTKSPPVTVWDSLSIKKSYQWHGWVTHARIDENLGIRGHDLCFDKTCQGNCLAKRAEVEQ